MRRALTLRERLDEARTELWLCRLACDITLARWAASVTEPGPPPAPQAGEPTEPASSRWPAWQPIWLHERCRPVALKA